MYKAASENSPGLLFIFGHNVIVDGLFTELTTVKCFHLAQSELCKKHLLLLLIA